MAADIPAAIGYLAGSLLAGAAEVGLIANRQRIAAAMIGFWASSAERARPGLRWLHASWTHPGWGDPAVRARAEVYLWLPAALFLCLLAVVLVASGLTELLR